MKTAPSKVSFCIVCMNRLEHLMLTLKANIKNNRENAVEFVLLDYSSTDGLEQYIKENFHQEIEQGVLCFYRYNAATHFNRSHSSNLVFKLATGDILCKLDADNYTGQNFAGFIMKAFSEGENIFLTPLDHTTNNNIRDVLGRIAVKKTDFFEIGGFDERMINYGFEDYDLVYRLEMSGLTRMVLKEKKYLKAITHSIHYRISNEFTVTNLAHVFIKYITPSSTEFIYLFKDQSFEKFILVNNKTINAHLLFQPANLSLGVTIEDDNIERGSWLEYNGLIELQDVISGNKRSFKLDKDQYVEVKNREMVLEAICIHSEQTNRMIMEKNLRNKKVITGNAWGSGIVFKNFNNHTEIAI